MDVVVEKGKNLAGGFDPKKHDRYPAGTPGGLGGQFAPKPGVTLSFKKLGQYENVKLEVTHVGKDGLTLKRHRPNPDEFTVTHFAYASLKRHADKVSVKEGIARQDFASHSISRALIDAADMDAVRNRAKARVLLPETIAGLKPEGDFDEVMMQLEADVAAFEKKHKIKAAKKNAVERLLDYATALVEILRGSRAKSVATSAVIFGTLLEDLEEKSETAYEEGTSGEKLTEWYVHGSHVLHELEHQWAHHGDHILELLGSLTSGLITSTGEPTLSDLFWKAAKKKGISLAEMYPEKEDTKSVIDPKYRPKRDAQFEDKKGPSRHGKGAKEGKGGEFAEKGKEEKAREDEAKSTRKRATAIERRLRKLGALQQGEIVAFSANGRPVVVDHSKMRPADDADHGSKSGETGSGKKEGEVVVYWRGEAYYVKADGVRTVQQAKMSGKPITSSPDEDEKLGEDTHKPGKPGKGEGGPGGNSDMPGTPGKPNLDPKGIERDGLKVGKKHFKDKSEFELFLQEHGLKWEQFAEFYPEAAVALERRGKPTKSTKSTLRKAFVEHLHPRGKDGRWIPEAWLSTQGATLDPRRSRTVSARVGSLVDEADAIAPLTFGDAPDPKKPNPHYKTLSTKKLRKFHRKGDKRMRAWAEMELHARGEKIEKAVGTGRPWDPTKHPRHAPGSPLGGRFRALTSALRTPAQRDHSKEQVGKLSELWAQLDRQLLPYAGKPDDPEARKIIEKQKSVNRLIHHYRLAAQKREKPGDPGVRDVVVVGGGPAGMSAAIYGATEGLDTLLIDESPTPGGQSEMSSRIENVMGFPVGISGADLARVSFEQAQRVGASTALGIRVDGIELNPDGSKTLHLSNGTSVKGKTVVIAGGVQARRLPIENADATPDVVYGDSRKIKAQARGKDAIVVGGGNSAGQAAIDAVQGDGAVNHVTILLRKGTLSDGMSEYLVEQIESDPKIDVVMGELQTANLDGRDRMESVTLKDGQTLPAGAAGIFIGWAPDTTWASGLERSPDGSIVVGRNGQLETSMPGVYAAGDIRAGSIHRVISAAADGAAAIHDAHSYLADVQARSSTVTLNKNLEGLDANRMTYKDILLANSLYEDDEADKWMDAVYAFDILRPFTGFDPALGEPMTKRFDPSQPRDKMGRWARMAGLGSISSDLSSKETTRTVPFNIFGETSDLTPRTPPPPRHTESFVSPRAREIAAMPDSQLRDLAASGDRRESLAARLELEVRERTQGRPSLRDLQQKQWLEMDRAEDREAAMDLMFLRSQRFPASAYPPGEWWLAWEDEDEQNEGDAFSRTVERMIDSKLMDRAATGVVDSAKGNWAQLRALKRDFMRDPIGTVSNPAQSRGFQGTDDMDWVRRDPITGDIAGVSERRAPDVRSQLAGPQRLESRSPQFARGFKAGDKVVVQRADYGWWMPQPSQAKPDDPVGEVVSNDDHNITIRTPNGETFSTWVGTRERGMRVAPMPEPVKEGMSEADRHLAFHDIVGSKTYQDLEGNYRYRLANGKPGGDITPWSDAVRAQYPDHLDLIRDAREYVRGGVPLAGGRGDTSTMSNEELFAEIERREREGLSGADALEEELQRRERAGTA